MTGFSIDDVRTTLNNDVSRLLSQIEATARTVVEVPDSSSKAATGTTRPFERIGEAGHAIYGTTALVSAESLAGSARLLGELAENGRRELELATKHLDRARLVAESVVSGVAEMRSMLSLELTQRGEDAQWLALAWEERARLVLGTLEAHPTPEKRDSRLPAAAPVPSDILVEDEGAFSFEASDGVFEVETNGHTSGANEKTAPPPAGLDEHAFSFDEVVEVVEVDPIAQELREIFEEEARDYVVAVRKHLDELASRPDDLAEAGALERVFHTLKGAAATVGLLETSNIAESLQIRMQELVDRGVPLTPPALEEIAAETARLLQSAGIAAGAPALVVAKAKETREDAPVPEVVEVRATFREEALGLCDETDSLVARLKRGEGNTPATEIFAQLARSLHRLKGSALVAGEQTIADEASALQRACAGETGFDASPETLAAGIARLRAQLGRPSPQGGTPVVAGGSEHDAELWSAFSQECGDLLQTIEDQLLALEHSDDPRKSLEALLATYHTLKGVVNTMRLTSVGEAIHRVEDFVERLRGATVLPAMSSLATTLLVVHGGLRRNLRSNKRGSADDLVRKVDKELRGLMDSAASSEATRASRDRSEGASASEGMAREFEGAAERKFVRVSTSRLDELMNLAGELVVSRSRLVTRVQSLRNVQAELARGGRRLVENVDRFCDEHEFMRIDGAARLARSSSLALAVGAESYTEGPPQSGAWSGFSELEFDRYDDIQVLARSLAELTSDFGGLHRDLSDGLSMLTDDADALGKIVGGIQSEVTSARMVPLELLFARLRLPVRDAAQREGKAVRVVTSGSDVHLDKTIADALLQPMLHLVRNAVAHGIEEGPSRATRGKEREGTISLVARQELGQIVLEVRDDGGGLDLEKLRARGLALGLIEDDIPLDDQRVPELIFAHGLTTQEHASATKGRGVGCDVVRRVVERLNGTVQVETVRGGGTTFILTLPLTLAITRALLVRHREHSFALPLYFAERILDFGDVEIVESAGVRRVRLDGVYHPVTRLSSWLGGETNADGPLVVLRVGSERMIVQTDALLGQEEIVVKSLGPLLTGHPIFGGVTIRGTGEMVLIVDVPQLMQSQQGTVRRAPPRKREAPVLVDAQAAAAVPAAPAPAAASSTRPIRVLFVDDSLSVRKVAQRALEGLGVDVTLAVDGVDALAKLREVDVDVVFTDLEMPRMHGFELIRELRFLSAYADLPVIVVTSRSGKKYQDQARSLGATEYLTKPFTPNSLEAMLVKWGRVRRSGKQPE